MERLFTLVLFGVVLGGCSSNLSTPHLVRAIELRQYVDKMVEIEGTLEIGKIDRLIAQDSSINLELDKQSFAALDGKRVIVLGRVRETPGESLSPRDNDQGGMVNAVQSDGIKRRTCRLEVLTIRAAP